MVCKPQTSTYQILQNFWLIQVFKKKKKNNEEIKMNWTENPRGNKRNFLHDLLKT